MLPQPSAGRLDGVIMLGNNEGAMFVYNPTANPLPLSVTLDSALGFDCSLGLPVIVNVIDSSDRGTMPHHAQVITCGGKLPWLAPDFSRTASVLSLLHAPLCVLPHHALITASLLGGLSWPQTSSTTRSRPQLRSPLDLTAGAVFPASRRSTALS